MLTIMHSKNDHAVSVTKSKTGIKIINVAIPSYPISCTSLWINAGSRCDTKAGLAHFFEHLFITRTKVNPDKNKLLEKVESRGMLYNAATSLQNQLYYFIHPATESRQALQLLLDGMSETIFSDSDLKKEKVIILNEEQENRNDPGSYLWRVANTGCWSGHPLANDVFGTADTIKSITVSDLLSFKEQFFNSDDTSFVFINSDLDRHQQQKMIESLSLPKSRVKKTVVAPIVKKLVWDERAQTPLSLAISFIFSADLSLLERVALDLLQDYLASGWTSRLIQRLRIELGYTYWVYADTTIFEDYGCQRFTLFCQPDKLNDILSNVENEIFLLKHDLMNVQCIDAHRNKMLADIQRNSLDYKWLLYWYGWDGSLGRENSTPAEYCTILKSLTAEHVRSVAQKMFLEKNVSIAGVGIKPENLIVPIFR